MSGHDTAGNGLSLIARLKERGVIRVAASYAVIAWLVLQIGDVTLQPLGAPPWVMRALVLLAFIGFPIAVALAWFFELTPSGVVRDDAPATAPRPAVPGVRRYADVALARTRADVASDLAVIVGGRAEREAAGDGRDGSDDLVAELRPQHRRHARRPSDIAAA